MTNGAEASVSRISLSDGSVQRIPVGLGPGGIVIGFGSVWLTAGETTIWRLNPETRQVDKIIDVGGSPFGLTVGPDAVWATLPDTGTVVRIDPRTNRGREEDQGSGSDRTPSPLALTRSGCPSQSVTQIFRSELRRS